MPSQKKTSIVEKLTKKVETAKSLALIDYQGLTTKQLEELRNKVQASKGDLQIVKNTLLKRVLSPLGFELEVNGDPLGPTALLFSPDENSALKILIDFAKDSPKPQIKFGYLEKKLLSKDSITTLAKLPDKNTLLSKLLSTLKSPIYRLTYDLNSNQNKLVFILTNIKKEVQK